MSAILNRLAYLQTRRDRTPNLDLARDLVARNDMAGIREIAENMWNDNKNIHGDCMNVMYEIAVIDPTLVTRLLDNYIYQKANQTLPITITVKKQADFEILNNSGELSTGAKKAPISATYKNIGEEPIKDAVARLSIFKPFSSTDDQAFIGTLLPGEEKTVVFRLDVDSDATPKDYAINSEIKYTDLNGDTVISESMKIPVLVKAAAASLLLPAGIVLIIIIAAGGYMYRKKQKKA
jgi:hypothetical protein